MNVQLARTHVKTRTNKKGKKARKAAALLALAEQEAEVFLDERGEGFAWVREDGCGKTLRLRSQDFKRWVHRLAGRGDGYGTDAAIKVVVDALDARASTTERRTLWTRVAVDNDCIYVDLCDSAWRCARIDPSGWQIVPHPKPLFRRFSHQHALPDPERGGTLDDLHSLTNLSRDCDRLLLLVWLVVALVPTIARAILLLHGPQGGAKTTLAIILRDLLDPTALTTTMSRTREMGQMLDHHYVPLLDNSTVISDVQARLLSQAVTGGGFTKRMLYTDADDVVFSFRRPVIITAITPPSCPADLADRMMLVAVERIDPSQRREEAEVMQQFNSMRPKLLGAMYTALSRAMVLRPQLRLMQLPRLADFARWGEAVAQALGREPGDFMAALEENAVHVDEEIIEDDPVACAVRGFARTIPAGEGQVYGVAELLRDLTVYAPNYERIPEWPRTPSALGKRLVALRPVFERIGIVLRRERSKSPERARRWFIGRLPAEEQP